MVVFLFAIIGSLSVQFASAVAIHAAHQRSQAAVNQGVNLTGGDDANHWRFEPGVSQFAGECLCPDGKKYQVGAYEQHDTVKTGWKELKTMTTGYCDLACENGVPLAPCKISKNSNPDGKNGNGMKVTCVKNTQEATHAPDFFKTNSPYKSNEKWYGGTCYCPSGQKYQVDDKETWCGDLSCYGGLKGLCGKSRRRGDATCAPALDPFTKTKKDYYALIDSVGEVMGQCTCPSGIVFDVGVIYDHTNENYVMPKEPTCSSLGLACYGGIASTCKKNNKVTIKGRSVLCAPSLRHQLENSCLGKRLSDVNIGEKCWADGWKMAGCTANHTKKYDAASTLGSYVDWLISESAWTVKNRKVACYGRINDKSGNFYRFSANVGFASGQCACPDGTTYTVGNEGGSCTNGLACEGGQSSQCMSSYNVSTGHGMKVTCLPNRDAKGVPKNWFYNRNWIRTSFGNANDAMKFGRKEQSDGTWTGTCTCPDGQSVVVNDQEDWCKTLSCSWGKPSECLWGPPKKKEIKKSMMCTPPLKNGVVTNWVAKNVWAVGEAGWGGKCTCPDGQVYDVGAKSILNYDKCKNGTCGNNHAIPNKKGLAKLEKSCKELACLGGTSGKCDSKNVKARRGTMVVCREPAISVPEVEKKLMKLEACRGSGFASVKNKDPCWNQIWAGVGCVPNRAGMFKKSIADKFGYMTIGELIAIALKAATWPDDDWKWQCYGDARRHYSDKPVFNDVIAASQGLMFGLMKSCYNQERQSKNIGKACFESMWRDAGCTAAPIKYVTAKDATLSNSLRYPAPAVHETMTMEQIAAQMIQMASHAKPAKGQPECIRHSKCPKLAGDPILKIAGRAVNSSKDLTAELDAIVRGAKKGKDCGYAQKESDEIKALLKDINKMFF